MDLVLDKSENKVVTLDVPVDIKNFYLIQIINSWGLQTNGTTNLSFLKWLWGADIWLNKIPMLKTCILVNAIITFLIVKLA